jgi:hypothetical protein
MTRKGRRWCPGTAPLQDVLWIELAEEKSVSYHAPAFFLEVLPRKNRITLLLDLDINEVDDPSGIAEDTSQHKFFVNAVYEGGVYVPVREAGCSRATRRGKTSRSI